MQTPTLFAALRVGSQSNSEEASPFPNPASSVVHVPIGSQATRVSVYNALGQRLEIPQNVRQSDLDLDISSLPSGIYHLVYPGGRKTSISVLK
jgi:hypothetical protein